MEELFLVIGIGAGLDYGFRRSWDYPSWDRTLTKITATLAILIWAILIGAPSAVVLALGFSVFGDYSGSRGALNWLVLSATAFFIVHAIYMIEYLALVNRSLLEAGPSIILGTASTSLLIVACWRAFAARWLASVIYSVVMMLQFSLGQMVGGDATIIAYTTCLFFISAMMLALELFLLPEHSPMRRLTSPLIWLTYLAAQVFTAIALTELTPR